MAEEKTFEVVLITKGKDDKPKERKFDNQTALRILTQKGSRWSVKEGQKVEFNGSELVKTK